MNRSYYKPLAPLMALVAIMISVAFLAASSAEAQPVRLASTGASATADGAAPVLIEGTATFYHPIFDGKQTASGEVYDHKALTAAHKTLPFNTMVRITRMDTGGQVVVRINDRLPAGSARTIDLSGAAASRLDMLETGVVDVSIELLTPVATSDGVSQRAIGWSGRPARPARVVEAPVVEAPVVETRLEQAAPNASSLIYTLQIGSFASMDGARMLAKDYETAWIAEIDVNGRPSYRVYYSRFEDEEPARLAQQSLWDGGQDSFLRRIGS